MQEQRMLQDASMLTHLVMLYQVFLIVPDFCCQNGHWVETHQVRVNSRVLTWQTCINCIFEKTWFNIERSRSPWTSTELRSFSCLWTLAISCSFFSCSFSLWGNDKDWVILNDLVNKILYSKIATKNLKTVEKESWIEREIMFLWQKDLPDWTTPTTEVFWPNHLSC